MTRFRDKSIKVEGDETIEEGIVRRIKENQAAFYVFLAIICILVGIGMYFMWGHRSQNKKPE